MSVLSKKNEHMPLLWVEGCDRGPFCHQGITESARQSAALCHPQTSTANSYCIQMIFVPENTERFTLRIFPIDAPGHREVQ